MKLPVLHVGFHKCASTTLQRALFARHSEVASLGEPEEDVDPDADEAMHNAMASCHRDPAQRREFDLDASRRAWRKAITKVPPEKTVVFSRERLTRCDFYQAPGDTCLASKLHSFVGPARIIIMARNQLRLLESVYITRTRGKGPRSYKSPEQWFEANKGGTVHIYRFHATAEAYASVFGRENVVVYLQEELQADPANFAWRMCNFVGIDASEGVALLLDQRWNTRVSARYHAYNRWRTWARESVPIRRFVPKPVRKGLSKLAQGRFPKAVAESFDRFVRGGAPAKVELPARWLGELQVYYRDDNRQLAQNWNLPLEKYGYPL